MKFNRIGRILVCLVLICALVINISPIKAKAISVTGVAVMVAAPLVIASVFYGLGIMMAPDSGVAFNDLISAAESALANAGYVLGGMAEVYCLSNGVFRYGVAQDFITFLRNWAFEQGVVYEPNVMHGAGTSYKDVRGYTITPQGDYVVLRCNYIDAYNSGYHAYAEVIVMFDSMYYLQDGLQKTANSAFVNNVEYRYYHVCDYNCDPIPFTGTDLGTLYYDYSAGRSPGEIAARKMIASYVSGELPEVSTLQAGVALATIAALKKTLDVAYPSWAPTSIQDEEDEKLVYPLGLGQTLEETLGFTQEQIWVGESTYSEELTQDQTQIQTLGLLQNILQTVIQIPSQILAGLGQILSDVLTYLFVPAQTFIQDHVQVLKAEYKFLDPMLGTGEDLKLFFQNIGSQPPIIWIDLGAGTAWHPMGGKVKFIDLTWYAQYKPTVDPIVGGFIWLWVAWRLFKGIPGLLSGDSGTVGAPTIAPDFTFNQARLPAGRSRRKKDGE